MTRKQIENPQWHSCGALPDKEKQLIIQAFIAFCVMLAPLKMFSQQFLIKNLQKSPSSVPRTIGQANFLWSFFSNDMEKNSFGTTSNEKSLRFQSATQIHMQLMLLLFKKKFQNKTSMTVLSVTLMNLKVTQIGRPPGE